MTCLGRQTFSETDLDEGTHFSSLFTVQISSGTYLRMTLQTCLGTPPSSTVLQSLSGTCLLMVLQVGTSTVVQFLEGTSFCTLLHSCSTKVSHFCLVIVLKTVSSLHFCSKIVLQACLLTVLHACSEMVLQACSVTVLQSCSMIFVHACSVIVLHSCSVT